MDVSLATRNTLYQKIHELYVCVNAFTKVNNHMSNMSDTNEPFNPFESIGQVADNMDINTLFNGVEVKSMSAFEMIIEQIFNSEIGTKMDEHMNNVKDDDVNEAANKLSQLLLNDEKKDDKSNIILNNMLSKIKDEVMNLKNEPTKFKGKQSVEQLMKIAQNVAGNMASNIKNENINVVDLWDATHNLASKTTDSPVLKFVDNIIRSNIMKNVNSSQSTDNNNIQK
jgi:hypothetical protein